MYTIPSQPSKPPHPQAPYWDELCLKHNVDSKAINQSQSKLPANQFVTTWKVVGFNTSGGVDDSLSKTFTDSQSFNQFVKGDRYPVQLIIHDTADVTDSPFVWVSDMLGL